MQRSVGISTSRGKEWEWRHSLWLLWTFTLGFFGWLAFAYIGIRGRHPRWMLWAVFYATPIIIFVVLAGIVSQSWTDAILSSNALLGVVSIVHAFRLRKEYLLRLDLIKRETGNVSVTSQGRRWEWFHSLWMLWTLPLGLFSWVAYFYIAFRARRPRWLVWGTLYFAAFFAFVVLAGYENRGGQIAAGVMVVSGIVSVVHAFAIRDDYLVRLERRIHETAEIDSQGPVTTRNDTETTSEGPAESPPEAPPAATPFEESAQPTSRPAPEPSREAADTVPEVLEMDDLKDRVDAATDGEVAAKIEEAHATFEVDASADQDELDWAARVAVGLDALAKDFDLDALAYYYRGTNGSVYERIGAGLILGNSLLTARGIPAAGEGDLKNAVAMKVMDSLGAGGSFTEVYAMDFNENFILMGHDGPGHVTISDRKPVLRGLGLYHGKAGSGVSVEFGVKTGPVTIFAVTQTRDGRLKTLAAEGESIPGPTLKIGNTNSRLRFALPPAEFMNAWCEQGPTHHCALGVGHHAGTLRKVARLLGLELVAV